MIDAIALDRFRGRTAGLGCDIHVAKWTVSQVATGANVIADFGAIDSRLTDIDG